MGDPVPGYRERGVQRLVGDVRDLGVVITPHARRPEETKKINMANSKFVSMESNGGSSLSEMTIRHFTPRDLPVKFSSYRGTFAKAFALQMSPFTH